MTSIVDSPDPPRTERLSEQARFVHGLARALVRDADLAHDVAQDVMVAALQQQEPVRHWRRWLASVTRRLAGAAHAGRRQRARHEARTARTEASDAEQRTAERLALHRRLCDAVLALPEPYRTAVTLRYLEGLPPRAIARRLGREVDVVRQHVHRGLGLLRQRLDREFGDRSQWTAAFAACGLGSGGTTAMLTLLPAVVMKKFLLAASLFVLLGAWWFLRDGGEWQSQPAPTQPGTTRAAVAANGTAADATSPSREPATAPLARNEVAFVVRVIDDAARPLASVTVRCWRQRGEAIVRETAADGSALFAPDEGPGALRIEAPSRPPLLQTVAHLVGEQRIALPAGAELRGRMLVDGVPAPAGLTLGLSSSDQSLPADLPDTAVRWLKARSWLPQCDALTSTGGTFGFTGLPSNWKGALRVPPTHWVLAEERPGGFDGDLRALSVPQPRTDLVVMTTQLETITGRVVWDDDGEPVRDPGLNAFGEFADGDSTPMFGVRGDRQGRFAAGFATGSRNLALRWLDPARRSPLVKAWFDAEACGSEGRTHIDLTAEQLRAGGEVVVRLRRGATTYFRAVDENGKPVAEARVMMRGASGNSQPTDSEGRGFFPGSRDGLVIGAPGFQVTTAVPAKGAGTAEEPLLFVLQRDNRLVIRLRTPSGAVPAARRVELRTELLPFRGHRFQSELDCLLGSTEAGGSSNSKRQPNGSTVFTAWTYAFADAQGEVVLQSLEPGMPATVAVQDTLQTELCQRELVLPAAGETLTIDLVVDRVPRRLQGHVTDPDGEPLAGVSIRVETDHGRQTFQTGADGAFTIANVYVGGPLRIAVTQHGFASQERADSGVGEGEDIDFRLERGHRVHVCARDANDALVPVLVRAETGVHETSVSQWLEPGEQIFDDLPATVTFVCELGDRRFELKHDASRPEAVLRLPVPARVRVAAPEGWPVEPGQELVAIATPLSWQGADMTLSLRGESTAPHLLLPGRYRFALFAFRRLQGDHFEQTPQGPAAELELRAGGTTRVQLQ